jgi:1-deoxy-D-xylulose-5-phosphate reductoisomerase
MLEPGAAQELERRVKADGLDCEVRSGASARGDRRPRRYRRRDGAIVGIAGLRPTLAAARAGKSVLLANKESLVSAGPVFMDAVRASGASPAAHRQRAQRDLPGAAARLCAAAVRRRRAANRVDRFRAAVSHVARLRDLDAVTPEQACAHPNWVMGRKISVDSATMMNKGLEVIEAHWLFNVAPERSRSSSIRQSVITRWSNTSTDPCWRSSAIPDMRTPIAYALGFPERIGAGVEYLDLARIGALHFEEPDPFAFPCLRLAYAALRAGGSAPTVLNAPNEVAVAQFLAGRCASGRSRR